MDLDVTQLLFKRQLYPIHSQRRNLSGKGAADER